MFGFNLKHYEDYLNDFNGFYKKKNPILAVNLSWR